jgi:mono/diheme cytochrome c family protein
MTPSPTDVSTSTPIPTLTPTVEPVEMEMQAEEPGDSPPVAGDPERGREIFVTGGGVIDNTPCSTCHSLEGIPSERGGPPMQGISERAAERVPELSADEYLRQSIIDPGAYIVDGFDGAMGSVWQFLLSDEDIDDLVAFLLTQ